MYFFQFPNFTVSTITFGFKITGISENLLKTQNLIIRTTETAGKNIPVQLLDQHNQNIYIFISFVNECEHFIFIVFMF